MKPYYLRTYSLETLLRGDWKLYVGICVLGVALSALQMQPRKIEGRIDPVDGDSFYVGQIGVRLLGIDAPEWEQTCEKDGAKWPCGEAAAGMLGELVGGATVTCRGAKRDIYDRLIAVCTAGGKELNREMVERGFAVSSGDYLDSEARAKAAKAGIWAGTFDDPKIWRAARRPDTGS